MPIYEYECSSCGHRMDKFQKINDEPLIQCPECETENLAKLVSAAAFKLKGSGWYETDFKDKKPKPGADKTAKDQKGSKKKESSGETTQTPKTSKTKTGA